MCPSHKTILQNMQFFQVCGSSLCCSTPEKAIMYPKVNIMKCWLIRHFAVCCIFTHFLYSFWLPVHVSEVAALAVNTPASLSNSLTHCSTLHICQKRVRAPTRPWTLWEFEQKFCISTELLYSFISPHSATGPCLTPHVNKIVCTFRLQPGANKSCADSK